MAEQFPIPPTGNFYTYKNMVFPTPSNSERQNKHRPAKKKRKTLTEEEKFQICECHKHNPGLRHHDIGLKFNVDRSTITKVLRNRHQKEPVRKRVTKDKNGIERALSKWIPRKKDVGSHISDNHIMNKARQLAGGVEKPEAAIQILDHVWPSDFKQKYHIESVSPNPKLPRLADKNATVPETSATSRWTRTNEIILGTGTGNGQSRQWRPSTMGPQNYPSDSRTLAYHDDHAGRSTPGLDLRTMPYIEPSPRCSSGDLPVLGYPSTVTILPCTSIQWPSLRAGTLSANDPSVSSTHSFHHEYVTMIEGSAMYSPWQPSMSSPASFSPMQVPTGMFSHDGVIHMAAHPMMLSMSQDRLEPAAAPFTILGLGTSDNEFSTV